MKPTYEELEAKCQLQQNKLDAINKLMGVIESASDLAKDGIKKLDQQLAAVVAENAGLKSFISTDCFVAQVESETFYEEEVTRYVSADGYEPETPATDAAIANIQAQGVEMFAQTFNSGTVEGSSMKISAIEFAAQLRKGAEHE